MALPLSMVERAAIVGALTEAQGDRDAAAHDLGIGRTTLYRKLAEFKIAEGEYTGPSACEAEQKRLDEFHQQLMETFARGLRLQHAAEIERLNRKHLEILSQISRLIVEAQIA